MTEPLNVFKQLPEHESMDYVFLRKQGIREAQRLSGDIWTDFNEHDPGITILEELCYVLTDLGFRTNFSIKELLTAKEGKKISITNNAFYTPSEIFPSAPTSTEDYRKLIIGSIPAVKNAWVNIVTGHALDIKGLYNILLQVDPDVDSVENTKEAVHTLFNENRNLCEDIEDIQALTATSITISASIDLNEDAMGETVLANILFNLSQSLNPDINLYSYSDLEEEGMSSIDILDGPLPKHGFIKSEDLKPIATEIYISRLAKIIAGTQGVKNLQNFIVRQEGSQIYGDIIQIEEGCFLTLDTLLDNEDFLEEEYPVSFYKGDLPYEVDVNTTAHILETLQLQNKNSYELNFEHEERLVISTTPLKELKHYHSVQHGFPKIYGIGEFGISPPFLPSKRAAANQLKSYLLFFEQLMSNYLAQLANIRHLFSIESSTSQSYFSQVPKSVPNLELLLKSGSLKKFEKELDNLVREFDPFLDRRHRFLDHLTARFGEDFRTNRLIKLHKTLKQGQTKDQFAIELLDAKIEFLQNYMDLSKNRALGFNYTKESLDTDNVAGLKKRTSLLLGIKNRKHNYVSSALEKANIRFFSTQDENADIITESADTGGGDSSITFNRHETPTEEDQSEHTSTFASTNDFVLYQVLQYGVDEANYTIYAVKNEGEDAVFAVVYESPSDKNKVEVYRNSSKAKCEKAIEKLCSFFKSIDEGSEGFHIIEHILLRPIAPTKYGFVFFGNKNDALIAHHELAEQAKQKSITEDLLSLALQRQSYEIRLIENEIAIEVEIVLINLSDEAVAKVIKRFSTEEAAEDYIKQLIEYAKELKEKDVDISNQIELSAEKRKSMDIPAHFYSSKLSVVYPNWPVRFRNPEFKELLKSVIHANAPAHLGINYYGLDIATMTKFEQAYEAWLNEKMSLEVDKEYLDDLAVHLAEIIMNQQKPSEEPKAIT